MVEEQAQGPLHSPNQIFYLLRSTNPSFFQIPQLSEDVQFSFCPQYATVLPKFSGDGDVYLFLSEFEDVCSMMQFPNVP